MKRGPLFRRIIYSSWLIAIIPSIVLMTLIPPLGSRYKLLKEDSGKIFANDRYEDLDSDSTSEIVRSGKGVPYYHVLVMDINRRIYDQWNFRDDLHPGISGVFFGNYDNDRFREIYIFSHKGDSLFLNINEFLQPDGLRYERIYITQLGSVNNTMTSDINPAGFFDVTGDGFGELYFTIQTGFALAPRNLYYFDIINKRLNVSSFTGVTFQNPHFFDVDHDNKPEIFGLMSASGNYKVPTPFTDQSTWLMVYNDSLKFEFPPVEFHGLTNSLEIYPYANHGFSGYLMAHTTTSADTSVLQPRILMYSSQGVFIKEHLFKDYGFSSLARIRVINTESNSRIFIMENELLELNHDLKVINRARSPFNLYYYSYLEDIDPDGEKEFLLYSENEEKLVVCNTSLKILAETSLKATGSRMKFSHYQKKDHEHKLFLASDDNSYFLELVKNDFYFLGYLAYPGIYLLLVVFIGIINRINTYKIQQKERLKQRLLTLQLQGIKAQLDPHFTFNTLNSIASLFYLEDRQKAYDYMNKFTQLLRAMLNDAERIYRTLGEELDFVTTYLELEKMRFGQKFDFSIMIGENVSQQEKVPKLVLHTFAENAVKHGIMPCEKGGLLTIFVSREADYLKLCIEDNGIGRELAAGHSQSTGKGLKITGEFYDILNQLNRKPIYHSVIDLYDESGKPAGTRVEVLIPAD